LEPQAVNVKWSEIGLDYNFMIAAGKAWTARFAPGFSRLHLGRMLTVGTGQRCWWEKQQDRHEREFRASLKCLADLFPLLSDAALAVPLLILSSLLPQVSFLMGFAT
jgi:hypothetical protein